MNELNLYTIFKAILSKSKVIEGRFFVADGYGNDLNANNLGEIVKDVLGNMSSSAKYPVALMLPPLELVPDSKGWSRFKIRMFFLALQNAPIAKQSTTNTSDHPVRFTWKDMRECAGDFQSAIETVLIMNNALDKIRPVDSTTLVFERFSSVGNDNLAGVSVSFDMDIFMPCEMKDYRDIDLKAIQLNFNDIHPIHKHS